MKKILALVILLLLAFVACSTPTTEPVTDLPPAEPASTEAAASEEPMEEPSPTEEPMETAAAEATAPAEDETSAEPDEAANQETAVAMCDPADIPAPTAAEVTVRFLNLSGREISGIWHDMESSPGSLTEYFQLEDGAAYDQETFAGHEWLLKDEEGDQLLDYVASAEATQCVTIYPHYGYEGEAGPEHWGELSGHYKVCGSGQEQSPIDLTSATMTDLENIVFEYGETAVDIINKGHTIQVKVSEGSQISVNDQTYQLKQFHFHTPSEHTVDSVHYPMEMHLVHEGENKALAVVGVFIVEGAENMAFTPVWDHLPEEEIGTVRTGATIQVAGLLPTDQTTYRYGGSLTTPPCSEGVTWMVMQNPVEMSAEQIATLSDIISVTNRPLQSFNARTLQLDETP